MPPASQLPHSRIVQSRQNSRVKELRAALSSSGLSEAGRVGVEGENLLAEVVRSGVAIHCVFFRSGDEELVVQAGLASHADVIELPADIFSSAVTTESPQGIAALVEPKNFSLQDMVGAGTPLVVIAAGLQDPGNMGTLIRSAEAFGATGVIALSGTVSWWNAKAMRASSGSIFRLPVVSASADETFSLLRSVGVKTVGAVAEHGIFLTETDLTAPVAVMIGNEGRGLTSEQIAQADARVTIPCPGAVESLNAAIAGSILLYEASRQRAGR
jgi:RNA methyltransferase, TrmH family